MAADGVTVTEAADGQCAECPCKSGVTCTSYECGCGCDELLCVDCDPINALEVGTQIEVKLGDGSGAWIERVEPFYLIVLDEGAYEYDALNAQLQEQGWRIIGDEVSTDEEDEGCWHVRVGRTCAVTPRYGHPGLVQRTEHRCTCGYVSLDSVRIRSHWRDARLDVPWLAGRTR